ncbi:hypothetical protein A2630_01535 [Candidatus Woesebacteria bacterium RIFCSPHIGHO2_01_FULL_44_10]|uniref:Uncharacterized protein n=1 Tax=Candidatus Woesebacteria bacterium RIFCSPLOWO2_01_FULL_44_14 TaxID=1802525 RepID=A0A1F8C244_9BACT|nr:MAG: hypothetical protein A2630_01535 [Candidatus Woesebacteria bacterium RIFCSPHIGHO2_01_FULL_44_10]OGM54770.1 MAG: hypothetical protein A3F62_01725 [Candidatus Woesebacteria bacterium RIFCSPHIGHO2_12_FULL_44_11]OGM69675.1 MAG: hypothetical protein A2975_01010 [Candidatus Woesebacteria bacterium RIFCSPLOWO2_01_FULL_44_14]
MKRIKFKYFIRILPIVGLAVFGFYIANFQIDKTRDLRSRAATPMPTALSGISVYAPGAADRVFNPTPTPEIEKNLPETICTAIKFLGIFEKVQEDRCK